MQDVILDKFFEAPRPAVIMAAFVPYGRKPKAKLGNPEAQACELYSALSRAPDVRPVRLFSTTGEGTVRC